MGWTVRYFVHQEEDWERRASESENGGKRGHKAYALKQAAMWRKFADEGKSKFDGLMIW